MFSCTLQTLALLHCFHNKSEVHKDNPPTKVHVSKAYPTVLTTALVNYCFKTITLWWQKWGFIKKWWHPLLFLLQSPHFCRTPSTWVTQVQVLLGDLWRVFACIWNQGHKEETWPIWWWLQPLQVSQRAILEAGFTSTSLDSLSHLVLFSTGPLLGLRYAFLLYLMFGWLFWSFWIDLVEVFVPWVAYLWLDVDSDVVMHAKVFALWINQKSF